MGEIVFEKIHKACLTTINQTQNENFKNIGFWFFQFIQSSEAELNLHIPFFPKNDLADYFDYIRAFTFIYNQLNQERIVSYENTCLFNIFDTSELKEVNDLTIDFKKHEENLIFWDENIVTNTASFLPVFEKSDLLDFRNKKQIINTFPIFRIIRDTQLIKKPQKISLNNKFLTFNNLSTQNNAFISEKQFLVKDFPNISSFDDDAAEIEENLKEQNFKFSLNIKFPHCKQPHYYLTESTSEKIFKLVFQNRFAYQEIKKNELFLLKNEDQISETLNFNVIDTKHSMELFELLSNFKYEWLNLELNTFLTPFPKYWFLFLNPSLNAETWLNQFKINFPAVSNNPIINSVEKIIKEILKLDWIKNSFSKAKKIALPELNSSRKKRLQFILNNFKNYVQTFNPDVLFISSEKLDEYEDFLIIDSFNKIQLVNTKQQVQDKKVNIIIPDFLYFNYNPWIKLHCYDYEYDALTSETRKLYDDKFDKIKNTERKEIIKQIKSDLKRYKKKYFIPEEILENENPIKPIDDDLEFTQEEQLNISGIKNRKKAEIITINDVIKICSDEKVLVLKDYLIYVDAQFLNIGDNFISEKNLNNLFKDESIYDKLIKIPSSIKEFQSKLSKINNVFTILKNRGVSYTDERYFIKRYASNKDEMEYIIPKTKLNWEIICELLDIQKSDQDIGYIAYYGREQKNKLKKTYKEVVNLLYKQESVGQTENPEVIDKISEIINKNISFDKDLNLDDISKTIVSNISNNLKLIEVKKITNGSI